MTEVLPGSSNPAFAGTAVAELIHSEDNLSPNASSSVTQGLCKGQSGIRLSGTDQGASPEEHSWVCPISMCPLPVPWQTAPSKLIVHLCFIMALEGRKAHKAALNISLELFLPTHCPQHHPLHCILSETIQHQLCQSSRSIQTTL